MSDKYTEGLLNQGEFPTIVICNELIICNCRGMGMPEDYDECEANAARLAAAWNSCSGLPTAALTPGLVGELVAACEALLPHIHLKWSVGADELRNFEAILARVRKQES